MPVAVGLRQLDVHARAYGERTRFAFVVRHEVAVRLWAIAELVDRVIVGDDKTGKAPLVTEHGAQQPAIGVRRHSVDLVVRRHHADGASVPNRGAEGLQEDLAQLAHRDVGGPAVHPRFGLPVRHEVLERRQHARLVAKGGVALEAVHGGDAHARHEMRVLAEGLFDAPPSRISRHVDHRRECLMRASDARLERRHRVQLLDEPWIERGRQPNGLRKARRIPGGMAVQTFLMEDHRNAEPALFDEELLDRVGQRGLAAGIQSAAGVARPANLPNAVPVRKGRARLVGVERTFGGDERVGFLLPHAGHLRRFVLEGHAPEEVGYAARRGEISVLVFRSCGCSTISLAAVGAGVHHPGAACRGHVSTPDSAGTSDR